MKENSKHASSLTYGPREDQILKAIDEADEKKYPSKNEVLRRGLHSFTYLYNVNENSQFDLLYALLESLSKKLDKQILVLAKDVASSIQSILVVKYGLAKADSFATIPNTLENLANALQQNNVKQTEVEDDVKKTIADLAVSLQTIFMNSDQPKTTASQFLTSIVGKLQKMQQESEKIPRTQYLDKNSFIVKHMPNVSRPQYFSKEYTILVIDDSHSFSQYLEANDFNVIDEKYDDNKILHTYVNSKPDLILFNFKQCKYEYFSTLTKIQSTVPSAKIIVITDDLTRKTSDKLKSLNVKIVYDPFDISNLITIIRNLIVPPPALGNIVFTSEGLQGSVTNASTTFTGSTSTYVPQSDYHVISTDSNAKVITGIEHYRKYV